MHALHRRALPRAGLALGLTVLVAACQAVDRPVPAARSAGEAATALPLARPADVEIFAVRGWQTTGIRLEPGVTYRVTAAGTWSVGPLCGVSDPNGAGTSMMCRSDTLGLGAPSGVLIGRIGPGGKPFIVGAARTLKSQAGGELFLGPYDPVPGDNSGSLQIRIVAEEGAIGDEPAPPHHDLL